MLYKTNIFGIVGSEKNPDYKQNHVLIYDDLNNNILYQITMNEKVLNLKLKRDRIFIVCFKKIYILDPKNGYQPTGILQTEPNPNGLLAINYNEENTHIKIK